MRNVQKQRGGVGVVERDQEIGFVSSSVSLSIVQRKGEVRLGYAYVKYVSSPLSISVRVPHFD
jgi:hypothetical protein